MAVLVIFQLDTSSGDVSALTGQAVDRMGELATNPVVTVAGLLGLWTGFVGVPVWLSCRRGTRSLATDFGFRFRWAVDIPLGLGLALGLRIAESGLAKVGQWAGIPAADMSNSQVLDTRSLVAMIVLGLCVGLGAPVAEELFFRGLTLRAFAGRFGPAVGVVASSLLFGLMHLQGFTAGAAFIVLLTGLVGATFAVVTLRSGRLGPAVIGHIAFNTSAVMVAFFA